MKEFRTRWLPCNWEEDICMQTLASQLDPKQETFETWATKIQTLNVALHGTVSHIDNDQLQKQLEANVDQELRSLARKEKLSSITEFLTWYEQMTEIDIKKQSERKHMADVADERM